MKIAILIPTIKPGGAEKQAALLAATLSQEHDVHFISLWGKKNLSMTVKKFLEDAHVHIHYLSGKRFGKWKEYHRLLKDYFEKHGFCKKKTIVIHNCFPDISDTIVHEDKQIKTIITVGRFEPQKDYLTAIKTIAELRKTRQDFVFTIIGHGHLEAQIRTWVKEYGLTDYTLILIAPNNVQEILKSADIYLSTSLFEGTSNSIMEAMNWSIPVVATNVGDNNVLVEEDKSGYLTPIGDVDRLVKGLSILLSSYQTRVLMGQKGHENLYNFSPEKFRDNYNKILKTKI